MLAPSGRRYSLGASEDGRQSTPADTPQHETRASRHGKTPVNYSAKWHPMDDAMRPKRARELSSRRTAVCSDSEPESFSGGDTGEEDDLEKTPGTPFEREPDAGATRRSVRSEARKPVNYSKAHHPQDHLLPGYRNRAKRQRRSTSATQPQKRKISSENIVISSQTLADSGTEGGKKSECDDTDLQAADPVTDLSPRGQQQSSSARRKHATPTDAAEDLHHTRKVVSSSSRGEPSFNRADAIIRGHHHIDQPGVDSQRLSQAVDLDDSDENEDVDSQSTETLISGATAILASIKGPHAVCSDEMAGKQAQGSTDHGHRISLQASYDARFATSLMTLSSALDKPSTQAGSWGLNIVRPYSTPRVEPLVKCQPSPTQKSESSGVIRHGYLPNKDTSEAEHVRAQERSDTLNSQDDSSQPERVRSSEVASCHHVARTEQVGRGPSDSSSRDDIASHDPSDHVKGVSAASRQGSRETQPEELLCGESHFDAAMSSSQSPSRRKDEDEVLKNAIASPRLPDTGQKDVEGNAAVMQPVSGGQPLVSDNDDRSHQLANVLPGSTHFEGDRIAGQTNGPKGTQSRPASSVPVQSQRESATSSPTQSDDSLLLGKVGL